MILLTHIILAIISTVYALILIIAPSQTKLRITHLLTLGTVLSGIVLTILSPQLLGQTCITGGIYLGMISIVSLVTKKRLAF